VANWLEIPTIERSLRLTAKQWNADQYNDHFAFIWEYGAGVLDLLQPLEGERILDLGCGTGHLTAQIADSGAEVIGIDHSGEMIEVSRRTYPSIEFHQMDATAIKFDEPFDAVFSNAVLHWVHPPEKAIAGIRDALKPGGRFVAEFGGHGNVGRIVQTLIAELEDRGYATAAQRNPWFFPSIAEYTQLLESAGLEPVLARLYDRPTRLDGDETGLAGWLGMFGDSFLQGISAAEREQITNAVAEKLRPHLLHDGIWYADYRRLQVVAYRG
jgi:trans-aconitate methyltransferase